MRLIEKRPSSLSNPKKRPKPPSDPQEDADEHFATSSPRGGQYWPLDLALTATDQIGVAKTENDENCARLEHFLEQTEDRFAKSTAELIHSFASVFMRERPNCHAKTSPGEHHGGRELRQPFST
jgi:hypothetical protein